MKIAFFTDTYYPQLNGVTISVDNFAKELRKKGHTVYIFAPKIKKRRRYGDQHTTNLTTLKILSTESPIFIPMPTSYHEYSKLFRLDFDLVHAHGNGVFSLLGYQVARMKRVPYVLTFHTLLTKYTHYFLRGKVIKPRMVETGLKIFANLCDGIITPSEKMKQELTRYGVRKPIQVVPNFIEKEDFTKVEKNYLHKKLKLPSNAPILLSVGRLGKEKNFEFVLEVFKDLVEQDDKAHLVIVGHGTDSRKLKHTAETLGLAHRVHFTGKINKKYMPSVYKDATIFVFASVSEVHPLVTLEACAASLPLVVAKDAAFTNVVVDKKNGFMLPLQKKQFVEKLQLLLKDQKLRDSMGKASLQIIDKNFPAAVLTDQLLKIYEHVLATKREEKTLQRINNAALRRIAQTTRILDRFFTG
jgi:1,2-diacylglycerol 3-alpha-glucosyltransferase